MSPFVLLLDWEGFERDKYVHTVLEDNLLPNYLENCSWFVDSKGRNWRIKITGAVRMKSEDSEFFFIYIQAKYNDGEVKSFLFPVSFVEELGEIIPGEAVISKATLDEKEGFLIEAVFDPTFRMAIFKNITSEIKTEQINDEVLEFERGYGMEDEVAIESSYLEIESMNSAFVYDNKYFFKLYRTIYEGTNPEIDLLKFLSRTNEFKNHPKFCGAIHLSNEESSLYTFGILLEYLPEAKDNWSLTGDYLNDFITGLVDGNFQVKEQVFVKIAQLGKRTAMMHSALFDQNAEEALRPSIINRTYRRNIHRSMEDALDKCYEQLIDQYMNLDEQTQILAWQFMEAKDKILNFVDQILTRTFNSLRIRIHGDFHLAQVLVNTNGFYFIDFEGDASQPISSRIVKHSPLKDVASMIRSYHYAVSAKLYNSELTKGIPEKDLIRASDRWYRLMKDTFLDEYLMYFGPHHTLLKNNNEVNYLLQYYLLEKSISELAYEMNTRASWVKIPLKGILDVVREIEKLRSS